MSEQLDAKPTQACHCPYHNGFGTVHTPTCPHRPRFGAGVTASTAPANPPREPNCNFGDPVDARGLVHAWVLVTDNAPGDLYECARCGQTDVD